MSTSPFVGRVPELEALEAALRDARAGRGRLVLLEGEPGIGKTRLARELALRAETAGARVGVGRAWDGGGAPPWFVWTRALRALGAELSTPSTLSGDEARFVLLQEIAECLRAIAAESPAIVVLLDDLQWADAASLLALRFVARDLAGARVLIVATLRAPNDAPPDVREHLDAVRREATVFPLRGLDAEDLAALARARGATSESAGALLRSATGGNALYAHEILLESEAVATLAQGNAPSLPRSLGLALDRHLSRLAPEDRAIVAVAALGPQPSRVAEVADAAGVSPEDAQRALDAAVAASILTREGDEGLRFAHDLLRHAARAALPAGELRARHEAWARALASSRDDRLADVAFHLFAADPSGTSEAAADAAIAAARAARSKLAFEAAAAHVERAAIAHERAGRDAPLGRALALLAHARFDTGDTAAGTAAAERALAIGRRLADPELVAESALAMGRRRTLSLADRPLAAVLEEALAGVERLEGDDARRLALRCALEARLACALQPDADPDRALALARGAIGAARASGDRELHARTLHAARPAFRILDDLDERLGMDRELLDLAERLGDDVLATDAHARLLKAALEAGDAALVDLHDAAYQRLAAKVRLADHALGAASARVVRAALRGDLEAASRGIAELEATHETWAPRLASAPPLDPAFMLRTMVASASGSPEALAEIASRVSTHRVPPHVARLVASLFLARAGKLDDVRPAYEQASERALQGPPSYLVWTQLGEICVALRDASRAPRFYALLAPSAGHHVLWLPFWSYDGSVDRLLGGLAAVSGRGDVARAHYAHAIAAEESLGATPYAARTRRERDALLGAVPLPPPVPERAAREPSSAAPRRPPRRPRLRDGAPRVPRPEPARRPRARRRRGGGPRRAGHRRLPGAGARPPRGARRRAAAQRPRGRRGGAGRARVPRDGARARRGPGRADAARRVRHRAGARQRHDENPQGDRALPRANARPRRPPRPVGPDRLGLRLQPARHPVTRAGDAGGVTSSPRK